MDLKNIHQSKTFRGILIGLVIAVVVLMIFKAGELVGYRKAAFSYRLGDNYYRAFEGPGPRTGTPGMMLFSERLPGGHGAAGKIISINLPTFVVDGPDGIEKTIVVDDHTAVRRFRDEVDAKDLKTDDFVTVLGEPDAEGRITAKLIRVMPAPPTMSSEPTASSTK